MVVLTDHAATFAGGGDHITLEMPADASSKGFTFSCWVRPLTYGTNDPPRYLFYRGDDLYNGYGVTVSSTGSSKQEFGSVWNPLSDSVTSIGLAYTPELWSFFSFRISSPATLDHVSFFLDGVPRSVQLPSFAWEQSPTLYIGGLSSSDSDNQFNGMLAHIQVTHSERRMIARIRSLSLALYNLHPCLTLSPAGVGL